MSVPYVPFPQPPEEQRWTLDASARISVPEGWLEINEGPYRLGAGSFGDSSHVIRKTEVTSALVPGRYYSHVVDDSVSENVEVWVSGDDWLSLKTAVERLRAALQQMEYVMEVRFENAVSSWRCHASDVTVRSQKELKFSKKALVSAAVMRLPGDSLRWV